MRSSQGASLEDKIGLVRITLRRVIIRFRLNNLDREDLANEEVIQMAGLVMAGACSAISALSGQAADGMRYGARAAAVYGPHLSDDTEKTYAYLAKRLISITTSDNRWRWVRRK